MHVAMDTKVKTS